LNHRISKGLLRTVSLIMCFLTLSWGWMPVAQAVAVVTPPLSVSCEVTTNGDVSITFDKDMADPTGKQAQFTVKVNDVGVDVTGLKPTETDEKIKLVLANKVVGGQSVTVAYNMGSDESSQIVALDGGILETFPAQTVTNNLPNAPPVLSADATNNIVGQAVEITFTANSAWKTAITEINADGVALGNTKYSINNESINIAADVFTSAKDYNIVVKATGYADASINQAMTAAQTNDLPKTPPALSADITNNSVGQAVEITFNDDSAWRTAITEIDADGVALGNTKYSINNGSINIAADVFTSAKAYTIIAKATGYADASINQAITAAQMSSPPGWASDAGLMVSEVSSSSFNLSWPTASAAESYKVVVSNTIAGVSTDALNTTITEGASCAVTGLTANRHYDIKVTAANSAGDSPTSLEDLVVTTPTRPLFEFMPAAINDSNYRYKFQPAGTKDNGRLTPYETVYVYDNTVDPASANLVWYMQGGFNGALAALKDNIKSFRLFNVTDGQEVPLNYGSDAAFAGLDANPNRWGTGASVTSGDFTITKLFPYSVLFSFQPNIGKYLQTNKEYAITIDPQCNTGGANPNVLGKVYRFEFSTYIADKQAPAWENGAQISVGAKTCESIALSWPAATDNMAVAKYKIVVSKNGNIVNNLETTIPGYTVAGLSSNTEYSFAVTALDGARNESSPLAAVTAKTQPAIPVWSANAALTADSVLATELVLRWPHVSNTSDLAGYKVYVDGAEDDSLPAMQSYYELYGLNSGQKYTLAVQPFNEIGQLGNAIETMVVTPGAGGVTFNFSPAATDQGETSYYHNYAIINPVDLDNFSLGWNFGNGLDKNLRFNLESIHLINKSSGQEIPLDLGTQPYVSTLEGIFYAGDFKYISTGGGTGGGTGTGTGGADASKTRLLKFEPGATTLAQITKGGQYVIEIDPEFTANNGTAKLGKIYTFAFTTAVDDTEAPTWPVGAQITASKVGTDALVLSWPQAADNIGITEYQLYKQGETLKLIQAFGSQTTSYKMEGLVPNTTYNLVLRARDAKSHFTSDLNLSVKTLLTDDQAPTWSAGTNLTADNILYDNMDLKWTPADDNVEVTGYRLLKNGSKFSDFDANTFTYHIARLTPATSYIFKVEARDKQGNYSASGPKLAISTIAGEADTTAPYWTNNGSWSTSTTYNYDKTYPVYHWAWAADNVAVTAYLVYRNGVQYATVDAYTNSFSDTLDLDNSRYTYSVYAVDASGNRSVEGHPMTVGSGDPNQDTYSPIWPAETNITLSEFTDTNMKVKWTPAQDNVAIRGYVVIKDGLWVEATDRGEVESDNRSFKDCFVVYNPIYNPGPAVNYPPLVSGQTYTFSIKAFDPTENSSKGDPKITFVMGTDPTAGAGIPFRLTNADNKRGSLNNVTGALNQVLAAQDPENIKFTWEFDEHLATGYADKISLSNAVTGEKITLDPADFLYSESNGKGIMTLDLAKTSIKLADNTKYVVLLDKSLASQSGKQLGFNTGWEFTTDVADKEGPQWEANDTLNVNYVKAPTTATLTWPAAKDNVAITHYKVYQGDIMLANLPAETLTLDVEGLQVNSPYSFKVVAGDYLENLSSPLTKATTTPVADSAAPTWQSSDTLSFTDIASDNVTVTWPAASDNYKVKAYKVYKDTGSEPLAEVASDVLTYTITGLAGETSYNITVKAFDFTDNSSGLSGNVTTIADNVNPVWPEGCKLQAKDIKDTSLTLYWDAATDNVGVTKYHVYRNGELIQTVDGTTKEVNVSGLNGATAYSFKLEAEDSKGNKTTARLGLSQWTAPNSTTLGAAFPFSLEKPLSHNIKVDQVNNTIYNAVDGSFTKNNVGFTFAFSKKLADGTWLNNIELKDPSGTIVPLDASAYTYMETIDNTSKLKIIVPASLVSNGEYALTINSSVQAADQIMLGRNFIWSFNVSVGPYGVTDIAAGYYTNGLPVGPSDRFYLMLKDDGSVWTWGNNTYGTLGDGTTDRREVPTKVEGLTGIVALEAGLNSAFALDQDGAVWGWGSNEYAQLGRGTVPIGTSGRYGNTIPAKVAGLPAIEKISFGLGHVVALDVNGEVWQWGNAVQSGYSEEAARSGVPLKVSGLANVIDVAAGYNASVAVTSNGDVYTFNYRTPVKIESLNEIVAVDAQGIGGMYMAVKADGTAYIWAMSYGSFIVPPAKVENAAKIKAVIADGPYVQGTDGQVSNVYYSATPVLGAGISTLNNVLKMSSSKQGGLALQTDGKLLQFIGTDATEVPLNMNPVASPVWPDGSALSITNLAETGLTLNWQKPDADVSGFAIFIDGTRVTTVSGNTLSYDVLGLTKGQTYTFKIEARYVDSAWTTTGPQIKQTMIEWNPVMPAKLAMSGKHTLMVGDDGSVWAWGQNDYGQLGIGNNSEQLTPVKINSLTNIAAVAVGDNHSLALDKDGSVWAWGKNDLYQLGNDSTINSNIPIKIITGNIKDISSAANYSLALKKDGTVLGWGEPCYANCSFALEGGSGHTPVQMCYNNSNPADVHAFTGVKDIAAGRTFSVYLFSDGRICRQGYFIDEVGAPTYWPMRHYSAPLGIAAIAAGENFVIALKEDGTVLAIGDNNAGQYGNGTLANGTPANPRPYGVATGLNNIVAVAAGGYHGIALDQDGNVYTWGKNLNGQLGTGKTDIHLTPVKVAGLQGITAIGGGAESSIAFRNMQKVYTWGNNENGQFGNNSQISSKVPMVANMVGYQQDIDAPVWPAYFALIARDITANSTALMWTPANDDIGVTAYEIYVDGVNKAEVDGNTREYTVDGLEVNTLYTFSIKAKDAAGNISVMSKTLSVTAQTADSASNDNDVVVDGDSGESIQMLTPELSIPNNSFLDVGAGLAEKNGDSIQVNGENKDLTKFVIEGQSTQDLTGAKSIGDQQVTIEKAVQIQSAVVGDPTIITNAESTDISASIPDGTTILAPQGWDGTIKPPTTVDKVGTAPSGFSVGGTVLEVGSQNGVLLFDKPVILTLSGVTGSNFGYKPAGSNTWVKMSQALGTYANPTAPAFPGEAYITNGTDTKIITWHFTQFASLDTVTPSGGGGDGGGGGASNASGSFTASFSTSSLDPANTVLRFDFSNGIDQNLSACLTQIHVSTKTGNTPVQYSSQNYIKQGSGSDTIKIRRLELTFNNLQAGTTYVVKFDAGFSANNGAAISGTTSWQFTTTGTAVTTPVNQGITTTGGVVSDFGAIVTIPSNAFGSEIKVRMEQVSNTSGLPVPANSKLIGGVIKVSKDIAGNFSKPVTISMSFDPSQIDLNKYSLSIYWLNETTGKWVKLDNVKINMTAGTVSGEVIHFTNFAVIATEMVLPGVSLVSLNDIADHWAEAYINQMAAIGATGGYPDGSFKPNANISRAEFVTMLVKAFGLEMKTGKVFDDTANSWAKEYVATACANGITGGYSDSLFGTEDSITREQMAVMLVKAAHLSSTGTGKTFSDDAIISSWAKEAVNIVTAHQIMTGYADGTFGSQNFATRAEAVTVIALSSK